MRIGHGPHHVRTSLTGVEVGVDVSGTEKIWRTFQAIGDIAFAYAYSTVLIEIQASSFIIYIIAYKCILIYARNNYPMTLSCNVAINSKFDFEFITKYSY